MRRTGLIVALGALLGMLAGAAAASPALAAGRGPGWTYNPPGDFTQTLPAGFFCPFQVDEAAQIMDKSFTETYTASDGATVMFINGVVDLTFTNAVTGKTITTRDSGVTTRTLNPDGSFTAVQDGAAFTGLAGFLSAQFGLPPLFGSSGRLTVSVDSAGNISVSLHGHVLADICAALS